MSNHVQMLIATLQATVLYAVSNVCGQLIESWRRLAVFSLASFRWPEFVRFVAATTLLNPPCFYWQCWLERRWPGGGGDDGGAVGRGSSVGVKRGRDGNGGGGRGRYEVVAGEVEMEGLGAEDEHADTRRSGEGQVMRRRSSAGSESARQDVVAEELHGGTRHKRRKWWLCGGGVGRIDWRNVFIKWALDNTVGGLVYTIGFIVFIETFKFRGWAIVGTALARDLWPLMTTGALVWAIATFINFIFIPAEKRVVFLAFIGLFWGIYLSIFEAEPEQADKGMAHS